jgi:hypothetical protein
MRLFSIPQFAIPQFRYPGQVTILNFLLFVNMIAESVALFPPHEDQKQLAW